MPPSKRPLPALDAGSSSDSKRAKPELDSLKEDLVTQFCNVLKLEDRVRATTVLSRSSWDLSEAILSYSSGEGDSSSSSTNGHIVPDTEDQIRAPIAAVTERLREDEPPPRFNGSMFNFYRPPGSGTAPSAASQKLQELFRLPTDITTSGTLAEVCSAATSADRWLLVSVHDATEFTCQCLNRDVWRHELVKAIVKENFVFWQVVMGSPEGNSFSADHPKLTYPNILLFNPLTLSQVNDWSYAVHEERFIATATSWLTENPTPSRYLSVETIHNKPASPMTEEMPVDTTAHLPTQTRDVQPVVTDVTSSFSVDPSFIQFLVHLPDDNRLKLQLRSESSLRDLYSEVAGKAGVNFTVYSLVWSLPPRTHLLTDYHEDATLSSIGFQRHEKLYCSPR